ncbi:MAG: calcium-binding protein, partial [Planctomycetaceae bacterium]
SHGGGITVENGSLSRTDTDVTGNTAVIDAGGLYAFNSNVFIEQSRIEQNGSGRSGGGLAIVGSTVQFLDTDIVNNSATDDGGGVAVGTGSSVIFSDSTVHANSTGDFGGGLHVIDATVSIVDATVSGNSAAVSGGGINNERGTVTLSRSTVSGNQAADAGGGIDNFQGLVGLNQTTVSGNRAATTGGGVVNFNGGTIEIQNSTIVGNAADQTGGGLWNAGTARIGNSIIARNTSATAAVDVDGFVVSLGNSLLGVGDGSTGLVNGVAGNLVGTFAAPIDPGLSPLQDNGGATLSHLPLFGSVAIDAGTLSPGTAIDQRGRLRVSGENLDSVARTDIGAVEFEGVSLTAAPDASSELTVSRDADELLISNSTTGRVLFRLKVDLIDQIQFNGAALNDSLIVDLSSGNPLPVGGFEFIGSASGVTDLDSLTILTGSVQTAAHTILSASDGSLALDGRAVTYTGVESLVDSAAAQEREFLTGESAESLLFANAGTSADGMMSLSRGAGAPLEFLATGSRLTVRDAGGASVVRFDSVDALFTAAVEITTGDQSDQIDASILGAAVNVNSGAGNDTVITGAGDDVISTGAGQDLIEAGDGNDTVMAGSQIDTLRGGAGNDVLLGQGGSRDVLTGGPGDDILHGGGGEDYLRVSGDLNYTLTDTTLTGEGNDILISLERAELTGGSGDNRIDASQYTGVTTIEGGAGNDTLIGGAGNDQIVDSVSGNDRLEGNGGSDILIAGQGRDTALGGAGNDFVLGNGGSGDQLSGGSGADLINGGGGNDILFETLDVAQLLLRDNRLIGDDTDRLFNIEQARLTGGAAANLFDAGRFTGMTVLFGLGGDDFLIGGKAADIIYGGDGNDSILGRAGNDTIYGEAGDDTLKGDGGDDLILGGTGNDGIAGRTDNDTLIGDLGEDTVLGDEGDDFVLGGGGSDTVYGGAGADRVIGNGGMDELGGGNPGQAEPDPGDSISGFAAEVARIDDAFVATADWILNG